MDKLDEFARQRIERDLQDLKELIESHFVERKQVWSWNKNKDQKARVFNIEYSTNSIVTNRMKAILMILENVFPNVPPFERNSNEVGKSDFVSGVIMRKLTKRVEWPLRRKRQKWKPKGKRNSCSSCPWIAGMKIFIEINFYHPAIFAYTNNIMF